MCESCAQAAPSPAQQQFAPSLVRTQHGYARSALPLVNPVAPALMPHTSANVTQTQLLSVPPHPFAEVAQHSNGQTHQQEDVPLSFRQYRCVEDRSSCPHCHLVALRFIGSAALW